MRYVSVFLMVLLFSVTAVFAETAKITKDDILKITASSETQANKAVNIYDGDAGSRWESAWADPAWVSIELKEKKVIEAVNIKWENAAAKVYKIQTSKDGKKWDDAAKVDDGKDGESRTVKLDNPVTTKFVRIFGEQRTHQEYGYSIFEVELNPVVVYEKNWVQIKGVEASSEQKEDGKNYSAKNAIDGDQGTRWSSDFSDPQWIKVELKEASTVSSVKIKWEAASAKNYKVQVSDDGKTWKEVSSITDGLPGEERVVSFKSVKTKFVRIYGEARNGEWGYSIFEIGVYK